MDLIAKQRMHIILLVDTSTSMRGKRIAQVNDAITEIKNYLQSLQVENSNVDFYLTIITFSTEADIITNNIYENVNNYDFQPIKAGGWSNLHLAYEKLDNILKKESKGGIMPDFGGIAPIILLLTDGHPTNKCNKQLESLYTKPWFNVALRYGIAIELRDDRTKDVLKNFVGKNGEVIECFDSNLLKRIIKVIVLTASKVKSKSTSSLSRPIGKSKSIYNKPVEVNKLICQEIKTALDEVDDWEW